MTFNRPIDPPDFATDAEFGAGAGVQVGDAPRLDPGIAQRRQGWYGAKRLPARFENFMLGIHGDWINYLAQWFSTIQVRNWQVCAKDFDADGDSNWDAEPVFVEVLPGCGSWLLYGNDNADVSLLYGVRAPGESGTPVLNWNTEIQTVVSGMTMQRPRYAVANRADGATPAVVIVGGKDDAAGLNLFRSVNGGNTYTKVVADATATNEARLAAYDPTAGAFYIAAPAVMSNASGNAFRWLWRSTDAGATWTCVSTNLPNDDLVGVTANRICAGGGTVIVVGFDSSTNTLAYSSDNGATWDSVEVGTDDDADARICWDESTHTFFLLHEESSVVKISYSTDYGVTWNEGPTVAGVTNTALFGGFITNQQGTLALGYLQHVIYFQCVYNSESGEIEFSDQSGVSLIYDSLEYPPLHLAYADGQFCLFCGSPGGEQLVLLSQRVEPLTIEPA
jgi:hypothetical protein